MKFIGKLLVYPLLAVNILIALLLIFSCYGSLVAPIGRWPFASLSGLAFPMLYLLNFIFLILWLFSWKKGTIVPIVTMLICIVPTLKFFPLHFSKSKEVQEPYITVVSYNTEGFGLDDNKEWTLKNPVVNYILDLKADIIFLQEANSTIVKKISRDKNITDIYPYVGTPTNINNSQACISKYPILHNKDIAFEKSNNGFQYLRILVGSDTLAVYNIHLQSNKLNDEITEYQKFSKNPNDSAYYAVSKKVVKKLLQSTSMRADQARNIADLARNETARYMIVCGDFNDTPLSYSYHLFDRFMYSVYAKSGRGMGITYHEHKLYYRIDHIFCSKNITPLYTWIDRVQKDSDHYPVISKIRLE